MNTKKICIISPSLKIGGIERALSVLANYFVSKNYQVTFISCLASDKFYKLDEKIKFIEPNFKRTASKINKLTYYPRMVVWLRKQVKVIDPDVVLTFGDNFNPLVLLALTGLRYPVYISDRTSPDFKFNPLVNKGKQWLYPKSAGFIAQSTRAAEFKKKHFGDKLNIKIIPNAIKEVKLFSISRKEQVVYVGRLSQEKAPERLLEAFARLKGADNWKLIYAGTGPMMEELTEKAKLNGLEGRVVFLGQVKDVDRLLAESSIFVLPSRLEGFPNALCEAMAAGLPSICFDCIPSGDVITNELDGFIVPDGDIDALSDTIKRLIVDNALRKEISDKAMLIRNRLSADKVGDMYLDFILKR